MKNTLIALILLLCTHSIVGMDTFDLGDKNILDLTKMRDMAMTPQYIVMDTALKLGITMKESDIVRMEFTQSPVFGVVLMAMLNENHGNCNIITGISAFGISRYKIVNKGRYYPVEINPWPM